MLSNQARRERSNDRAVITQQEKVIELVQKQRDAYKAQRDKLLTACGNMEPFATILYDNGSFLAPDTRRKLGLLITKAKAAIAEAKVK